MNKICIASRNDTTEAVHNLFTNSNDDQQYYNVNSIRKLLNLIHRDLTQPFYFGGHTIRMNQCWCLTMS